MRKRDSGSWRGLSRATEYKRICSGEVKKSKHVGSRDDENARLFHMCKKEG